MRHRVEGKKFGRTKGPRELMLRNLATSVILYERVKTTLPKAKTARMLVERLVARGKKADLGARRYLMRFLLDKNAVEKILREFPQTYQTRQSGFTRIIKLGERAGDGAQVCFLELVK